MPEKSSGKKRAVADKSDKRWARQPRRKKDAIAEGEGFAPADALPHAAPDKKIEIYEQQIRNLRAELESFKLQSILQGLNAAEKIELPVEAGEEFDASFFAAAYYSDSNGDGKHANPLEEWGAASPAIGYESPFPIPRRMSLQRIEIRTDTSAMSVSVSLAAQLSAAVDRIRTLEKFLHFLAAKAEAGKTQILRNDISPASSEAMLAEMYMEAEKKIESLRAELEKTASLEKENRSLRSINENLAGELRAIISDIDARFAELTETQIKKLEAEQEMKFAPMRAEMEKLKEEAARRDDEIRVANKMISERDSKILELQKIIDAAKKAAAAEKPSVKKQPVAMAPSEESPPGPELEELLKALIANPSLESILRVRSYFLKTRRHTHGVKTYLELLDRMGDNKLLPAICVLIGEIYLEMGRKPEAEYYLNSRMVRDDALAMSLLKNIPAIATR